MFALHEMQLFGFYEWSDSAADYFKKLNKAQFCERLVD